MKFNAKELLSVAGPQPIGLRIVLHGVAAVNLGNGQFSWIVTQPSPWVHGFCYEITGSVLTDSSPVDNTACRSLTVGGP
jgi:hypothetical protein